MTRPPPRRLLTPWGERLDPDHPLPEYPRPQFVRDSYLNLNGRWEYAITRSVVPPPRYDGTIVVPYPPESLLSGVGRVLLPDEVLHYRRGVVLPAGFRARPDDRLLLHLGAVDRWCRITVDDRVVGEHDGGCLPFTLDVTDALASGSGVLQVAVCDPTDTSAGSRGKQRLRRGGIWYTPHSGIWQTVWCEAVPAVRIDGWRLRPVLGPDGDDRLEVTARLASATGPVAGEVMVAVRSGSTTAAAASGRAGEPLLLPLPGARRWSPEDPFCYDVEAWSGDDVVRGYAGIRSFGVGPDRNGVPRLLLNGRPYFHAGVLDQGYWSDGLCTPPSDDAMVHDIATMKRLGFTMLRKHVKVEPLRWYHHCDRLGMLVWQDAVNGGARYRTPLVSGPVVAPFRLRDDRYRWLGRPDSRDRARWERELAETVLLLRDVVSVCLWVPFNEGWGQFDAARVAGELRRLDPDRPVDHASGWFDQGAGDLDSRHVYVRRFRPPRRPGPRVLALTEYGGYSWRLPPHASSPREFGYRRYRSAAALLDAFRRLHTEQLEPAIEAGLSATVYTQVSDVEDETNGLLTYDRRVCKLPAAPVREVLVRLRLAEQGGCGGAEEGR